MIYICGMICDGLEFLIIRKKIETFEENFSYYWLIGLMFD